MVKYRKPVRPSSTTAAAAAIQRLKGRGRIGFTFSDSGSNLSLIFSHTRGSGASASNFSRFSRINFSNGLLMISLLVLLLIIIFVSHAYIGFLRWHVKSAVSLQFPPDHIPQINEV